MLCDVKKKTENRNVEKNVKKHDAKKKKKLNKITKHNNNILVNILKAYSEFDSIRIANERKQT